MSGEMSRSLGIVENYLIVSIQLSTWLAISRQMCVQIIAGQNLAKLHVVYFHAIFIEASEKRRRFDSVASESF